MKVKELIEKLKKFNPEMDVEYWDAEDGCHYPIVVSECREHFAENGIKIIEIDREG